MRSTRALAALALLVLLGAGAVVAFRAQKAGQEARRLLLKRQLAWTNLGHLLEEEIRQFHGEVGLVIEDLERGWRFSHQATRVFPAASLVKVPIMAGAFQAAAEGRIDLAETVKLRSADKVGGSIGMSW